MNTDYLTDNVILAGTQADLITRDDVKTVMADLKRQVRMERPSPTVTEIVITLNDDVLTYEAEAENVLDCYWFFGPRDWSEVPITRTSISMNA